MRKCSTSISPTILRPILLVHSTRSFTQRLSLILYTRHAQHTARGPNVALKSLQSGPQSPNLCIFGLIFNVNTIKIRKKLNQSGPQIFQQHFFGPPWNLSCASLLFTVLQKYQRKSTGTKAAWRMLVKLTPGWGSNRCDAGEQSQPAGTNMSPLKNQIYNYFKCF